MGRWLRLGFGGGFGGIAFDHALGGGPLSTLEIDDISLVLALRLSQESSGVCILGSNVFS